MPPDDAPDRPFARPAAAQAPAEAASAAAAGLRALSAAAADGDAAAYAGLVERLAGRVFGFAVRLLGDRAEAEDVTQESFARLWRAYDVSPPKGPVEAWLFRTARNLCIDRMRRLGRLVDAPTETVDGAPDPAPSAEARWAARETAETVQAALDLLPERQKSAILLVHFQDFTGRQAAEAMAIGEEALESLLARGRRKLRALLAERRDDL
ncbi:MAG: sigma-70 family RNA polymerase sigma factor [Alphaproteobacteria bacterium]|nr:sigma-70 family RNA polymerase sigma factor [Alphaproteobacteria bacterium]